MMFFYCNKSWEFLKPYWRLMRIPTPTGFGLLLFPCWWGLSLATCQFPIGYVLLFAVGAFIMRSAGCIINDIVDREVDCQVRRTQGRPLVVGTVSLKGALVALGVLLVGGGVVLWGFHNVRVTIVSLLLAMGMVGYPFLKRITSFPQLFLGLIFNGGILVGWLAVYSPLAWEVIILYLGGVMWTLGYDTLYALQDIEDDRQIGVGSLASWLGPYVQKGILGFYLTFCGVVGMMAVMTERWALGVVMIGVAGGVVYVKRWLGAAPSNDKLEALFRKNIWIGVSVWAGILMDNVLRYRHVCE